MLRGITLGLTVGAALALYFALTLYVFPQSYESIEVRRPAAVITGVDISANEIELGDSLVVSVAGANSGEEADMQIVSIAFPNFTSTGSIQVLEHDFAQTPFMVSAGDQVGSEYEGEKPLAARYVSVEAFSRPWPAGNNYGIKVEATPESEGRFAVFVKSVAFPHSWDGAHWPQEGFVDYQKEFVQVHYVNVTKP